tara:strand:+ start:722 stop:1009 length:288 start_codon:yes stop_codon:yes gene_type:complete
MNRKAKGTAFKMRSGNSPLFKDMGDAAIIAAATPQSTSATAVDYTLKNKIEVEEEDDDNDPNCDAECRKAKREKKKKEKAEKAAADKAAKSKKTD